MSNLPTAANAMYSTWWQLAMDAATEVGEDGQYVYSVADVQAAASQVNREVFGGQGGYNPIGMSQLFSAARSIANAGVSLGTASDADSITDSMVALAPWARSSAEMNAMPQWQARISMTYTDAEGTTIDGYTTVLINQVLPYSVGSLRQQMTLRVQDQLATPPGTGTPRIGNLISVNSITLLAV